MENFNKDLIQPFYNTIQLSRDQWEDENCKALKMTVVIKNIYASNPTRELSGWLLENFYRDFFKKKANINSIRRTQSNLKTSDFIIKTTIMRMGDEGKPEHIYVLKTPENLVKYKDCMYEKIKGQPIDKILTNIEKIKNKDRIEFFFEP